MRQFAKYARGLVAGLTGVALAACGGGGGGTTASGTQASPGAPSAPVAPTPTGTAGAALSLAAQVGQKLFFDPTLSASGKMSCATCHDPNHAHAPPNNLSVQLGGPNLNQPGSRAVPSLRYKEYTPAYADLLSNPDGISQPGPGGGFTWDGRVNTLADQAALPLMSPVEMANVSQAAVVKAVQAASYAPLFRQAFGSGVFADAAAAFANIAQALQAYQREDPGFHPYSSKFDLYAGNKVGGSLTAAEIRGMRVFTDPARGNCASCHYQGAGLNGSSALFTDFSYEAIGVPRNMAIAANQMAGYYDLGVCGPNRSDHAPAAPGAADIYCGMFKTPTLRNAATRQSFFHNGVMHTLEQVIRFYNTRDTYPEIWYPTVGGTPKAVADASFPTYGLITTQYVGGAVRKYDDMPAGYVANIDPQMPLDGRKPGSMPPMSEQNISDLLCFLNTLTDGYKPPASAPISGACVN